MSVDLTTVVSYLDRYLLTDQVADWENALNGLQVENSGSVSGIAAAVDACQFTIDKAAEQASDLLLVHHGLFWSGLEPVAGRHGRRLRSLFASDMAVYASHLPLDMHPEVGNNVVLAKMIGLVEYQWFGDVRGQALGVAGKLDVSVDELTSTLGNVLGVTPHVIRAGASTAGVVGVATGGGGAYVKQALEAGVQTYVTGEGLHHSHFDAEEWGVNLIYAGHYATETVGVQALAQHVSSRFGIPWHFIDHPTGL